MTQGVIDEAEGLEWAGASFTRWQRVKNAIGRTYHIKLLGKTPTVGAVFLKLLQWAIIAAIASAPYWPAYFEGNPIEAANAPYYFGAALFLLIFKAAYDRFMEQRRVGSLEKRHKAAAAAEQRNLFTSMRDFTDLPSPDLSNAQFMELIQRALGSIAKKIKEETGALDATYLQVSLLLFQPDEKIEVVARAESERPTRRPTDRNRTMAYFVARAGLEWKQVPDLKSDKLFDLAGISQADCPYRSILLIPVTADESTENPESCGVITIDSGRAFEFWDDSKTQEIFLQVMPFVRLLACPSSEHLAQLAA
ncbi:hypothetical protein [Qipengyuania nanhaisediminis]|uniref:Uncharacterized protein n=1 Tax=Qipengyuania nanhaisediminis TaxID=604088 RepID=A0A1I5QAL0_9SPHN|nr:hypothetical protein [Qipengyuania nanhaisediminis]SFP43263.1 hypothetical protein SAMN04488060_2838 [Qipengyuania nanhaisediminis]